MTTNPDLVFALANNPQVTTPTGDPNARPPPDLPDPCHGCINGRKISTCTKCAGHKSRTGKLCKGCNGLGFTTSKCPACEIIAKKAFQDLVDAEREKALADERKEDEEMQ